MGHGKQDLDRPLIGSMAAMEHAPHSIHKLMIINYLTRHSVKIVFHFHYGLNYGLTFVFQRQQ